MNSVEVPGSLSVVRARDEPFSFQLEVLTLLYAQFYVLGLDIGFSDGWRVSLWWAATVRVGGMNNPYDYLINLLTDVVSRRQLALYICTRYVPLSRPTDNTEES